MSLSTLSRADLHKLADTTRREIEGYKLTQNLTQLGEANAHLTEIESEIMERTK
jgi:hypothetical protein